GRVTVDVYLGIQSRRPVDRRVLRHRERPGSTCTRWVCRTAGGTGVRVRRGIDVDRRLRTGRDRDLRVVSEREAAEVVYAASEHQRLVVPQAQDAADRVEAAARARRAGAEWLLGATRIAVGDGSSTADTARVGDSALDAIVAVGLDPAGGGR